MILSGRRWQKQQQQVGAARVVFGGAVDAAEEQGQGEQEQQEAERSQGARIVVPLLLQLHLLVGMICPMQLLIELQIERRSSRNSDLIAWLCCRSRACQKPWWTAGQHQQQMATTCA